MKDIKLSENFLFHEFFVSADYPELAEEEYEDALMNWSYGDLKVMNLTRLAEGNLQKIRDHFSAPAIITSGYRNEKLNDKVRGAFNSDHRYGTAADISVKGVDIDVVWEAVKNICEGRNFILYPDEKFVHVSINSPEKSWRFSKFWVHKA